MKDRIFSREQVNTSRQWELDLARAFIIFCLGMIHVTIECSTDEGLCSGIPYLFDTVIGGLGIFMVKKTMDEITYEYKDGQNILAIKKSLN